MARVSVIIPNYNHARYLDQRIRSVLDQTWQDFEVILLDDASTDGSLDVIDRYRDDPRIRVHVNETNSGSAFCQWNKGVSLASAPFVWIAEADDDADPHLLEALVARLEASADTVLAYCQSQVIDEHGATDRTFADWTDDLSTERWRRDFQNNGREECASYLVFKNTIPNASAVLFRKDAYLRAGGAPEEMRICGDWLTWVRILQFGNLAFVAKALNRFRCHGGSVRSSTSASQFCQESYVVARHIFAHHAVTPAIRRTTEEQARNAWRWTVRYAQTPPSWRWVIETARTHALVYGRSASVHVSRCLWSRLLRTAAADWLRATKHRAVPALRTLWRPVHPAPSTSVKG